MNYYTCCNPLWCIFSPLGLINLILLKLWSFMQQNVLQNAESSPVPSPVPGEHYPLTTLIKIKPNLLQRANWMFSPKAKGKCLIL